MRSLILIIFISMYSPNLYADWVTIDFFTSDKKNIGNAEGVDSWFLGLPAFKFNLKHLKPGEYRIALYDGNSCSNKGFPIHLNNPELISWNPENLLLLSVKEDGIFNTTLGVKPQNTTAENRDLISITTMRGKPLLLFNKSNNSLFACGVVPLLDEN